MEGSSVIKATASHAFVIDPELHLFMQGSTGVIDINQVELTRTALNILKKFPASRDSVLEYFCNLFDDSVANYVSQIEMQSSTSSQLPQNSTQAENALMEIHSVLCSYVQSNTEAWAPIISTWSLELLGSLSSKYVGHTRVGTTKSLSEALHLWMSCRATRTLIDLNTQCLSCLMHSDTEACIKALLDTSVKHSPHFDWVVAHVGSSFPHTVITRVLSCGLKDFCQNEQGGKASKINSVVGILGHLAGSHLTDISSALLELFQWSLEVNSSDTADSVIHKEATIPYLLELASLSSTLLKALTADVLHSLSCDVLRKMSPFASKWCNYQGSNANLQDLFVHLSLACSSGGDHVFKLLLDAAEETNHPMSNIAMELIELLLREMEYLLRRRTRIPLLDCIQSNILAIQPLLLDDIPLRTYTASCLLKMLGWQDWNLITGSLSFLLTKSSNDAHLATLVNLMEESNGVKSLNKATQIALTYNSRENDKLWSNFDKLIRWGGHPTPLKDNHFLHTTLTALRENMGIVAKSLVFSKDMEEAHAIVSVLDKVTASQNRPLSVQNVLWITQAMVEYFYCCLNNDNGKSKLRGCRTSNRLFARLSNTFPAARNTALRALIEIALTSKSSSLFGNTTPTNIEYKPPPVSLLQENLKQGTSTIMAQKHSSVFHTGIIGFGLRTAKPPSNDQDPTLKCNIRCLIAAITACCQAESPQATLDAVITVALLLVELISPDVMYNGLPWPEEDFCKVTVERDLHICSKLKSLPVIWSILQFIAAYRPALCYCSVILRAVAAILVGEWSTAAQQRKGAGEDKVLIQKTTRLLEIMALGQLLPPPLSSLQDAIPHLPPNQVVMLLRECLWNYMRDHVPSPALFARDSSGIMWRDPTLSRPPRQYTETFRLILQRNIAELGQLYALLFLTESDNSN